MDRIYKIIAFACLLVFAVGCGKEEADYIVPASPVNFKVNVNILDAELKTPTAMIEYLQPRLEGEYVGYSGLLVVCSANPLSSNIYQLFVYDLCCTYEKRQNIRITKDANGKAKCHTCGSVYNVLEGIGNPISGPSTENLQRYSARQSNTDAGIFYITR